MNIIDESVKLVFSNVDLPTGVNVHVFIVSTFLRTLEKYSNTIEVLENRELHEMCEFEEIHMNLDRLLALNKDNEVDKEFLTAAEEYMRLKAMDKML